MPRKRPKPKWGHRGKGFFDDFDKKHYTDEQVSELARLLPDDIDLVALKRRLDLAANQYFNTRTMYEDAPSHAESKAALEYLQNHARALLDGLRELDAKSWQIVLAPETEVTQKLMHQDKVMTRLGYEIVGERQPDGSIKYETLEPDDFVGSAEFIEFYITHALETFPESPKGKRRLLSLTGWLNHMESLWSEYLGKEFTLNAHEGQVTSEASYFCYLAISMVDPKVTQSNIISAMREKVGRK